MAETFSIQTVVNRALDYTYFDGPITAKYWPGMAESKLLVITGDNSAGKSFFGKFFEELIRTDDYGKIEAMRISMQLRTGQGMEKAFIFGDESWRATGAISANVVSTGFSTCRKREGNHILFLDEPDIGLSESYQGAVGKLIAEFAKAMPEKTLALCVVTHSRRIVRHLAALNPHYLRVGDELTLEEFLVEQPDREIADLEKLADVSTKRFRAINECMEAGRKAKAAEEAKERAKRERAKPKGKKKSKSADCDHDDDCDWRQEYGGWGWRG